MPSKGFINIKVKNVRRAIASTNRQIDEEYIDLIESIWFELVGNTPRDTGRAQHSWQILSKGQRPKAVPPGMYPGFPNLPPVPTKLGIGRIRVISPVPYMQFLNAGWSKQSPALFIEQAMDKVLALY